MLRGQEAGLVVEDLEQRILILHVEREHGLIEHEEVEVDLAERSNPGCQGPIRGQLHQFFVVDVTREAQVDGAVLILFDGKVLIDHVDGARGGADKINRIGLAISLTLLSEDLDVEDLRNRNELVELAAARENSEGRVVKHQYQIIPIEACMLLDVLDHVF